MANYPQHQRRHCPRCQAPAMAITEQAIRGRIVMYRWCCPGCQHGVWLPAPWYLYASLSAGILLAVGGILSFVVMAPDPASSGARVAAVLVGSAMTLWGLRHLPSLREHPLVE